jgi:rubrerythrin
MNDEKQHEKGIFDRHPMELIWKCLSCGHLWHRDEKVPDACEHCGALKTEFVLIEED